jgi:TolB-like protein/tetratricopeptide (TPR) repeat protein
LFRYVVAYAATSWAILEVIDQLVGNGVFPQRVYIAALTLVLCGIPGALIVSWFHGAKGKQEIPRIERVLLAVVVLFALGTTGFVARATHTGAEAVATALPPTEDPSRVAIMYMDARGGEDAQFLASGLTETLIDQLGAVEGVHVISRNGSQLFRGVAAPPDSVGRTLQVGSLVGGTVSVAGDRVRVDIALTSSMDGEQIASRRLERPRTEIFELQDELADTVSVFLRREIGKELGARTLKAATPSIRAWELVQQAGQSIHSATQLEAAHDVHAAERALNVADSLLALAEIEDPSWPTPLVTRGWVAFRHSRLAGMDRNLNGEWIDRGLTHADRAIASSPRMAEALELRATLLYRRFLLNLAGTPEEADKLYHDSEALFRQAIAAAGGKHASAQNGLSHLLLNKGEVAEAKLNALQAYTADPFLENSHLTIWRIFLASWGLQDLVEAERYCQEGMRRFPDYFRFHECQLRLAALPGAQPEFPKLWEILDQFSAASPPAMQDIHRRSGMVYLAAALARTGMQDSARSVVRRARPTADIDPLRELAHLETMVWVAIGDEQEAVRQLQLYLTANPQALGGLRRDAERAELPWYLQPLLDEPAFRQLVGLH